MLSARNAVEEGGKATRVGPRLLLYAPNVSNADLGTTPDLESRVVVVDEASATAMIVVPVTSARRTRINYLSPDDMNPLSRTQDETVAESGPRDALGGKQKVKCSLNQADTCTLDKPRDCASAQRLHAVREVAQQVVGRFDTDRQPQQAIHETGRGARLRRHGRVRHRGRVRHQALDATQRFGQREQFERL
jgi:hypothetical protein